MRAKALAATAFVLLIGYAPRAQVLEWASCYDGPGESVEDAFAVAVDERGHVYVTGASSEFGGNPDYATVKYAPDGDTLWVRRWESDEFVLGRAVLPDTEGNVYVTGAPVTLKYDADGALMWAYDHAAEHIALALDAEGDVVAAGTGFGDIKTIKLAPNGVLLWEAVFDGPAGDHDRARDAALDSEGNVVVVGESWGLTAPDDGTQWNYTTLKYDGATGDMLWARHYDGPGPDVPSDFGFAVTLDAADNVYVSGWSDDENDRNDCLTIKYSPEGETLWERRYPEGGTAGAACHDLLVIESPEGGALYAVAAGTGGDTLLKYDLDGNLLWSRRYTHTAIFATKQRRLAADSEGHVYVTSINDVGRVDFVVLKYTPAGERVWEFLYPGEGTNSTDAASALAVDGHDNVYVTGGSIVGVCPGRDYLTLKLSQSPVSSEEPEASPPGSTLGQSHPNPFRTSAVIPYSLPEPGHVRLRVFDVLGREVVVLVDGVRAAGPHEAVFEAGALPSGVYVVRLETGGFAETRSLLLLR